MERANIILWYKLSLDFVYWRDFDPKNDARVDDFLVASGDFKLVISHRT